MEKSKSVLIILHGALGDFFLSQGILKSICAHHSDSNIILLTTNLISYVAKDMECFTDIFIDNRQKLTHPIYNLKILLRIKNGYKFNNQQQKFSHIYDLQNSSRTALYKNILYKLRFITHKYSKWHSINDMAEIIEGSSTVDKLKHMLKHKNIKKIFPCSTVFNLSKINLRKEINSKVKDQYILLVPGSSNSKKNLQKRFNPEKYAEIVNYLAEKNIQTIMVGTTIDHDAIKKIEASSPKGAYYSFINKLSFAEIAKLANKAKFVLGNDTGLMHLIAPYDKDVIVLFNYNISHPKTSSPLGKKVHTIGAAPIDKIKVTQIISHIDSIIK